MPDSRLTSRPLTSAAQQTQRRAARVPLRPRAHLYPEIQQLRTATLMPDVKDNSAQHRYEMAVDDEVAFVTYETAPDRIVLLHTEVPSTLSGRGVGSALARGVLDDIRRRGLRVVPRCEFMASYIERHPAYADLVDPAA